ncbi:HAD-like domain-containing protein [Pelagophyceae sp. CCMP2097]|nr:HAD-like domain-containing protein [Pelagophyceae sp. CCMP2097]
MAAALSTKAPREITTLIFDIDDTLYPVSSRFSDHRNGAIVADFMVDTLGFASHELALQVRDEYFKKYHSTLKGLSVATAEGKLPKPFQQHMLGEYWAEHCEFAKFLPPNLALAKQLKSLRDDAGLRLVVFTNAPRLYGLRCLESLAVREYFKDEDIFAVEDVMPACKPEAAAFETVLKAVGADADECVMFEDSMKNIRVCGSLGMRTVFIDEGAGTNGGTKSGEAALLGDVATAADDVGHVLERIEQLQDRIPQLWQRQL